MLDVHAQALENLGVHALKTKPEDYAFEILSPAACQSIANDLNERRETREMHETAEYAVAAHWVYKSKGYVRYVELMADRRRRLEGHLNSPRT